MEYQSIIHKAFSSHQPGSESPGPRITKSIGTALLWSLLVSLVSVPGISGAADEADGVIFRSSFEQNPDAVAITSFSVLQDTVTAGDNIDLSWATENATSCEPSNGADGWDSMSINLPDGDQQIEATTTGTHQFTLTCSGPVDQISSAVSVTVEESPYACNVQLFSYRKKDWSEFFREEWPGPRSDEVRVTIPTRGYYSIGFFTGTAQDTGFFGNIDASGTYGYRLGAISTCPGDFNVPSECRFAWSGSSNGGIIWTTEGYPGGCQLDPNEIYYWNLTFTDGVDPDSSRCAGSYCETYFTVSNR